MEKITACIIAFLMMAFLYACGSFPASQQDAAGDTKIKPSPTEEPEVQLDSGEVSDVFDAEEGWKADFEASLFEGYGVIPERYEDLGDGFYQVYVIIDGNSVPYVTVNSATGDYHG